MAKVTIEGLDEYTRKLTELKDPVKVQKICKRAVYEGARVIADEIDARIDQLRGVTDEQRQGLHEGLGVARHRVDDGYINTQIGFAGYNEEGTIRGKRPKGQPNVIVARNLIRGASTVPRQDFVGAAVRAKRQEALQLMQEALEEEIQKTMK